MNIYQRNAWGFSTFTKHLPGKPTVFAIFTNMCLRGSCLGEGRCPKMIIAHQRLKCVMPVVAAMCSCSVSGSAFSRHRCRNRGTVGGRKNQTRKWVWWSGAPLVRERFFCSPLSPITMLKKGTPLRWYKINQTRHNRQETMFSTLWWGRGGEGTKTLF